MPANTLNLAIHSKLKRRLAPLYIAAFFQGMVFWYAIEKLFMKSIGISDAGVAVVTVVFTFVMMLTNLPFGILADRWSRRGVLVLATLFLIVGSVIDGLGGGFWLYLVGSCLWGMFFACYSGTYDSIVYDMLIEETGSANKYELYYGKVQLYDGIALVLSSLLAGVIVHYFKLPAAYFMTVPFSCLALVALWRFDEPKLHKATDPTLLGKHVRDTLQAVLRRREIFWLSLSLVFLTLATRLILDFDQLWLIALALPLFLYGPVNALVLAAYGGSGLIANLIKGRALLITSFGFVMTAAAVAMLYHVLSLTVAAFAVIIVGITALEVIVNRWLHDTLPSNIRAGASSTITTIGYAAFLPIGLLFGYVSKQSGIFQASWFVIGICALIAISVAMACKTVLKPTD